MTFLNSIKKQGTWKLIVPFLSFIFLVISCDKRNDQPYKKESTGPINQISVFSTDETYKEISEELNDSLIFGKVFPGLYYPPEAMFATRHFSSNLFDRFKFTRLVLKIDKGNPSILIEKDKYSRPQAYVEVSGNTPQEITQLLKSNQDSIINLYRWADRIFLLHSFEGKAKTPELDTLGVSMLIPKDFKLVESNPNFVWYRKDEINTITNRNANNDLINKSSEDILNILSYKVPYKKEDLSIEDVIKVNDSITALYMEGGKEPQIEYIGKDSLKVEVKDYVQIEKNPMLRDFYDFKKVKNNSADRSEYETQGYWSMTLSQMGGPYTIKAILDKKTHTLYIAEAVLFAPLNEGKSKKRDYLTQMEGLFTTFKINP